MTSTLRSKVLKRRFGYTSRVRRGGRTCRRAVDGLRVLPAQAHVVPTFWWENVSNFGDLLTPYLLPRYGLVPLSATANRAALCGVGSVLQLLPDDYAGVIWGSGVIHDVHRHFDQATILALRGDLTRDRLGMPPVTALGDPGLLVPDHISRPGRRWEVGLVLHFAHWGDRAAEAYVDRSGGHVRLIDARRRPEVVIREIASCEVVLSSSLHGLIMADAFGIPAARLTFATSLYGGDFKFHDHDSVARPPRARTYEMTDLTTVGDARKVAVSADAESVARAQDALRRSIGDLVQIAGARPVKRWAVPDHMIRDYVDSVARRS